MSSFLEFTGFYLFLSLVLYFIPFCIALLRGHINCLAIFLLNLLLGWTFIGWVVALVWAFTSQKSITFVQKNE